MNALELYEEISDKRIILHKGQVFFNSRDYQEALAWERRGARIVPHYTLEELKGREMTPGWEVHVIPLLDPDWEEGEEGEVNMAPERLRELCRTNW